MTEQLMFDFTVSSAQRHRRAAKLAELDDQPTLFASWSPDIDIHLHSPEEAIAQITAAEPERAHHWLAGVVGSIRVIKTRRVAFSTEHLDRLISVRPPAQITLDAASAAVAKAVWAHKLGLKPLRVTRSGQRLLASSPRWPSGMRIKDVPWTTIATLTHLGVPLDVADNARVLFARRLVEAGTTIATAGLAGSAVILRTSRPELIENMGLPGLAYAGEPNGGVYKLPLLSAGVLLKQPLISVPDELAATIRAATQEVFPLTKKRLGKDFPWTLFDFQAVDAGQALRILEVTGGVLLAGDMGSGKSSCVNEALPTPAGPVRAGDVRVGDFLLGRDGKPTRVEGVFPQGLRPMYRLTFSDGATAKVDGKHLWAVHTLAMQKRGHPDKVVSTADLLTDPRGLQDKFGGNRWYIPIAGPLQFEGVAPLPIDPYVVGALLGGGSVNVRGSVSFTSADPFIVDELQRLLPRGCGIVPEPLSAASRETRGALEGCAPAEARDCGYRLRRAQAVCRALRELGMEGKRSWEKSVPERYLWAPEADRRAVLQGLLDTGGGLVCGSRSPSSIEFTSTSERLADDVIWLVQSLGGTARKSAPGCKHCSYKGESLQGRPAWRLSIQLPAGATPFRLPRKAGIYVDRVKHPPTRGIKSIEYVGEDEAVCFKVAAADSLFLLSAAVATHNTTVSLALAQVMDTWPLLVVAPLSAFSTWERQLGEMNRSAYLATGSPKAAWEIIESGEHDAVVISYDRLPAFVELIERMHFRALVADEIQRIRTPNSKRSRALRTLAASMPIRIGLSGTPVTNTLADILAVGAALAPGEWRPRANSKDLEDMYPGDPIEGIAEHLGSMMVRRRIDQVGREMPERNDHRVYVAMTPEQRQAIAALEAEAQAAKESGEFDGPNGKFNALVKLARMRKIIANPRSAGVAGPNPKIDHAMRLIKDFHAAGRKGVVFTVDRASFSDLGEEFDRAGIRWGGIWGSTPARERIEVEKRLHRGELDVVLCTIAAGAESWTASPTATYCVFLSYVWAPSSLAQAEARVYRLNSDLHGPSIEIMYLHATGVGGTNMGGETGENAVQGSVDDRMVEVLEGKKQLFAQVVDRTTHNDATTVHAKLSDLLFVLTGRKDEGLAKREADAQKSIDKAKAQKKHAKESLYAHKARNRADVSLGKDDGSMAMTLEEHQAAAMDADVSALLEDLDYVEDEDVEVDVEDFTPDDDGDDDD